MKKEIISVFDGETERESTSAEEVGSLIFWTFAIPVILFAILLILFVLFILFYNLD